MSRRRSSVQAGYALLAVIVTTAVLLTTGAAVLRMTRSEIHNAADEVASARAFYIAEAGVERGLVQLSNDRATASVQTNYRFPGSGTSTESFGGDGGTNSIVIEQDPLFADTRRKRITSTGSVIGQTANVVAHAFVQDGNPFATSGCPILYSDTGRARLIQHLNVALPVGVSWISGGEIFSNDDVEFKSLLAVALGMNASVTVRARGDFIDSSIANLLTNLSSSSLLRGGSYNAAALHLPHVVLGICVAPLTGFHFGPTATNCGHGVVSAIPARTMPTIDYEAIRNHPSTVVVNRNNVPFGSWHAASGTWTYSGLLSFPASAQAIYYVEGNASLDSLQILREADVTIVTRGWLRLGTIALLNTDLIPALAENQDLRLVAEGDIVVGRRLLNSVVPPADNLLSNVIGEDLALTELLGLGTGTIEVLDRNRIFAFSERGGVWVKTGTAQALSRTNTCLMAKGDATLATTASILSSIGPASTPYFP